MAELICSADIKHIGIHLVTVELGQHLTGTANYSDKQASLLFARSSGAVIHIPAAHILQQVGSSSLSQAHDLVHAFPCNC